MVLLQDLLPVVPDGSIANGTITNINIAPGTITGGPGGNIGTGTVTGGPGGNIAANTITAGELAPGAAAANIILVPLDLLILLKFQEDRFYLLQEVL